MVFSNVNKNQVDNLNTIHSAGRQEVFFGLKFENMIRMLFLFAELKEMRTSYGRKRSASGFYPN